MKAPINRILPFSNVDGPGNRCAVFFQSCPFECAFCHNPETWKMCCGCGQCVKLCPAGALRLEADHSVSWDPELCVQCDTCIHACPHHATPKIEWLDVQALLDRIAEALPFIQGITVSGGECMNHPAFLEELFRQVKALGKTCLIDSNGAYDFRDYPRLLELSDGVMLDVKAVDPLFHQQLTHQDNAVVLSNLDYLLQCGKLEEVRTVLLPNHQKENAETVREVSARLQGGVRYKLLRYRPFGVSAEGLEFCGRTITAQEEADRLIDEEALRGFHNLMAV